MKKLRTINTNGAVIYQGPSEIDGKEIVAIITGLRRKTRNTKIGNMLQLWVLRSNINPLLARRTGEDRSICGDCRHRKIGSCYVVLMYGPRQIYNSFINGSYCNWRKAFPHNALKGRYIRLGAYGDPAALPFNVLRRVLEQKIAGWTAYTHQWRNEKFRRLRNFVMASVDSPAELEQATRMGWRTFRVRKADEPLQSGEIACPASAESGKRTACRDCSMCCGQRIEAKSIAIIVHGYTASRFK